MCFSLYHPPLRLVFQDQRMSLDRLGMDSSVVVVFFTKFLRSNGSAAPVIIVSFVSLFVVSLPSFLFFVLYCCLTLWYSCFFFSRFFFFL